MIHLRRYRCLACGTVLRVGPASCAPFKHFSAAAIAQAMTLWTLAGLSAAKVRDRVNDWCVRGPGARGWPTLRRWARDLAAGRVFRSLRLDDASPRELARRAAQMLIGHAKVASRGASVDQQAHAGARHVS